MRHDRYYIEIAHTVATRSPCFSRKVGAVVVVDYNVVSTGFNGPPRGVPHCEYRDIDGQFCYNGDVNKPHLFLQDLSHLFQQDLSCPRHRAGYQSGKGLHICLAVHGERNAVIGKNVKGGILYCNCSIPCIDCMKEIINAGIKRIVCLSMDEYNSTLPVLSGELAKLAGVHIDVIE